MCYSCKSVQGMLNNPWKIMKNTWLNIGYYQYQLVSCLLSINIASSYSKNFPKCHIKHPKQDSSPRRVPLLRIFSLRRWGRDGGMGLKRSTLPISTNGRPPKYRFFRMAFLWEKWRLETQVVMFFRDSKTGAWCMCYFLFLIMVQGGPPTSYKWGCNPLFYKYRIIYFQANPFIFGHLSP